MSNETVRKRHPRVGDAMAINITYDLFSVWLMWDRALHTSGATYRNTRPRKITHVYGAVAGEAVGAALWAPTYIIDGVMWALVGYETTDEEVRVGFTEEDPTIRPIPFVRGEVYECISRQIFSIRFVNCEGCTIAFGPIGECATIEDNQLYYAIYVASQNYLSRRVAVRVSVGSQPSIPVDLTSVFEAPLTDDALDALLSEDPHPTTECPICLVLMDDDRRALQCRHAFCVPCISQWLVTQFKCPVCRAAPL